MASGDRLRASGFRRLGLLGAQERDELSVRYTELLKGLLKPISTLEQKD